MGIYKIGTEELEELFKDFLMDIEGEVDAKTMVSAWNNLSKKYEWEDKISAKLLINMRIFW